jgi:hypothetical protein
MRLLRLCLVIMILACSSIVSAQSILQYSFKAGEHFRYHYRMVSRISKMSSDGGYNAESSFECDPDWRIEEVDMLGMPTVLLTVENQKVEHSEDPDWYFSPQSRLVLDRDGRALYGKIIVDGPARIQRLRQQSQDPAVNVDPDSTVVKNELYYLWYVINDTLRLDTLGASRDISYDTTYTERGENVRQRGAITYTLKSETLDHTPVWHLHWDREEKFKHPAYSVKHNSEVDTYFRKKDGLIQKRHFTTSTHNGVDVKTYELWLDLTSIIGD